MFILIPTVLAIMFLHIWDVLREVCLHENFAGHGGLRITQSWPEDSLEVRKMGGKKEVTVPFLMAVTFS